MERKTKICPYCGEWLENGAGPHSKPNGNQQSSETEAKDENRHNEA